MEDAEEARIQAEAEELAVATARTSDAKDASGAAITWGTNYLKKMLFARIKAQEEAAAAEAARIETEAKELAVATPEAARIKVEEASPSPITCLMMEHHGPMVAPQNDSPNGSQKE